ncbi:hypothetical protein [Streptomyces albireticuli]|uniref:hypothetical protein n=1 Tax=Streptomyces albireticuli TaxID=1940 RepID=UPI0036CEA1A2
MCAPVAAVAQRFVERLRAVCESPLSRTVAVEVDVCGYDVPCGKRPAWPRVAGLVERRLVDAVVAPAQAQIAYYPRERTELDAWVSRQQAVLRYCGARALSAAEGAGVVEELIGRIAKATAGQASHLTVQALVAEARETSARLIADVGGAASVLAADVVARRAAETAMAEGYRVLGLDAGAGYRSLLDLASTLARTMRCLLDTLSGLRSRALRPMS